MSSTEVSLHTFTLVRWRNTLRIRFGTFWADPKYYFRIKIWLLNTKLKLSSVSDPHSLHDSNLPFFLNADADSRSRLYKIDLIMDLYIALETSVVTPEWLRKQIQKAAVRQSFVSLNGTDSRIRISIRIPDLEHRLLLTSGKWTKIVWTLRGEIQLITESVDITRLGVRTGRWHEHIN